jgi:pimeloyl-ACP methyl ester carboxylesterase
VVFLHGVTDSWRSFEPVLAELPDGIRAFALTQRGHGDADRPETGYRPQDFASDVDAFMDALQLDQAVVVGHSMGGSVAQRMALDYPERLLGLVLAGALVAWQDQPDVADLIQYVGSELRDPVEPGFVAEFQQSTLAQPVPPAFFDTAVRESLKLPARVWRGAFLEGVAGADHTGLLAGIRAPTLLLCGDRDTFARSGQEALAEAIPGSRLVTYSRAGHALHWEEPGRFAADIAAFVHRVTGVSAGCLRSPDREPDGRRRANL